MEWYYARSGEQRGPVSESQMAQLIHTGQVRADDLVWQEGMAEWVPMGSVSRLVGFLATAAPPPLSNSSSVTNQRVTAAALAILLGWLGAHKFYLGMTGPGLILLLASLLSCLIASPITAIIGILEGVLYLVKSDAEFYQTYVIEKRPWF